MNCIEIEDESEFIQRFPLIHERILKEAARNSILLAEPQIRILP